MAKDKRRFQRYSRSTALTIKRGGEDLKARAVDYSLGGVCARIEGSTPLEVGDMVDIALSDPEMKGRGRVVWMRETKAGFLAGISRLGLLYGSLKDYRLPDVIMGLQRSGKTGVFHFFSGEDHKNVYIQGGDMIFASSSCREDRLGDLLLAEGRITSRQYDEAVEIMKQSKKRLGTVLVELDYLEGRELLGAVNRFVENIILSLFQYEEGDFLFKEGPLPTEELIILRLSTANLVLKGIKGIEDSERLRQLCPPPETVPATMADQSLFHDLLLDEDDKRILSLVDGRRSFKEIIEASGNEKFRAVKTLCALLSIRAIEQSGGFCPHTPSAEPPGEEAVAPADVSPPGEIARRIEEMFAQHRELGYYGVLGIPETATSAEIKRAYYQRAREFHPDRHFALAGELKDKLNTVFTYITTAFSTLNSAHLRSQYDSGSRAGDSVDFSPPEMAAAKFKEGEAALLDTHYDDAARLFAEAAYLDSSVAAYHYHTGLALTRAGRHREAERAIQRAIKLEPENPDYYAAAGQVFLALGFPLRAKGNFKQALGLDPLHRGAQEGMATVGSS